MSTNINISVGDNKLLAQASLQQNASRQAQLEKEANKRLQSEAEINRVNALAAQGKDANGNPLTGTRNQVPQLERKPAANRQGISEMLLYYKNGYTLRDILTQQGFAFAPIFINKKSSSFNFSNGTPTSPGDGFTYYSAGGPYDQSFIANNSQNSAVLRIGQISAPDNATQFQDLFVPISSIEKKFNGYTAEFDFYAGPDWQQVSIEINKYYTTTSQFGINVNGNLVLKDGIAVVVSKASGPNLPAATFYWQINQQDFLYLSSLPIYYSAWNRLAFTSTANTMSVFVNGTFLTTFNVPTATWAQPSDQYLYIKTDFSTFDYSGGAVSAGRLTPKILYTQNYTPQRIT